MLRIRRSNRAKDRIRMSLSFVFIWLFKLGLSGSQLVDREAKKGPLRPDGAGGGEGGRFQ